MSRILNGITYQTFFRFLTTKTRPIKKIKNEITKNNAPAIIGIAASSQLTRPSVAIGRAVDIPVPAKPSKTPRIPKTKTIFQSIDSLLLPTGWIKPTALVHYPEHRDPLNNHASFALPNYRVQAEIKFNTYGFVFRELEDV